MRFTGEKKRKSRFRNGLRCATGKKKQRDSFLPRRARISLRKLKRQEGMQTLLFPFAEISQVFWGMRLLISQASTSKLRRGSRVEPRRQQSLYSQRCRLGQHECVFPLRFLRRTAVFRFGRELHGVSQEQRHLS